jgi:hypothetical protein
MAGHLVIIQNIPLLNVLGLLLAFFLFPAPGLLAVLLYRRKVVFNGLTSFFISYTFSAGFYAILFAWLQPIKSISIDKWGFLALTVVCYLAILFVLLKRKHIIAGHPDRGYLLYQVAQFIIFLVILFTYLWPMKDFVAAMGSDSMHHTLIIQMIIREGRLPDNYRPLFNIVTFQYHFGYHLVSAIACMLSGITPRLMVLLSGPLLIASVSLATGLLAETLLKNRIAGLIATSLVGLAMIFPGYMMTWGRFPQLAALYFLAVTLLVLYRIITTTKTIKTDDILVVSVLVASIFLTHYKTLFFGLPALIVFFFINPLTHEKRREDTIRILVDGLWITAATALLCLPWLVHLVVPHYGVEILSQGKAGNSYYSLARMGVEVLNFPTTLPLLGISLVGAMLGLFARDRKITVMIIWILTVLALSDPRLLGNYMDPITIIISLFLPLAILIVYPVALLLAKSWKHDWIVIGVIMVLTLGVSTFGIRRMQGFITIDKTFPRVEDVQAAEWIKKNIPETALFMINTYNFSYSPKAIIGLDGGYWIPVLANRKTVVPPINTNIEYQPIGSDILGDLLELHSLNGQLSTEVAIDLLKMQGITYVYSGETGGPINIDALLVSTAFQLVYHQGNVFIFKFVE